MVLGGLVRHLCELLQPNDFMLELQSLRFNPSGRQIQFVDPRVNVFAFSKMNKDDHSILKIVQ